MIEQSLTGCVSESGRNPLLVGPVLCSVPWRYVPIISHPTPPDVPKKEGTRPIVGRRVRMLPATLVRRAWREIPMDLGTIIGYVLAWGALAYGAWHASHGALASYIKPGEILLVRSCALSAAMPSMPLH